MLKYQETNRYFAQIASGFEEITMEELKNAGCTDIKPSFRGIFFNADKESLYRTNYTSRLITRILAPLQSFNCHSTKYLYTEAKKINWSTVLKLKNTFAIFANVSNSKIRHSRYASLCLKDAIVDYFKENYGSRPDIDTKTPDVWINLHIENNTATISLDTSGGSLHKRGYRQESVSAPINETLAAAIIKFAGIEGTKPVYDPMCGSGTLLCESLMALCHIPSGYLRNKFGFENLPDFDAKIWKRIKEQEDKKIRPLKSNILNGSDISNKAIKIAKENLKKLPYGETVVLKNSDFNLLPEIKDAIIICNPPYGIRLKQKDNLNDFYKQFGDFLKQRCMGSNAYIYFGERDYIKRIGLKTSFKKPLNNGGLDGRLVKLELY